MLVNLLQALRCLSEFSWKSGTTARFLETIFDVEAEETTSQPDIKVMKTTL